jgi:hypothetical protein
VNRDERLARLTRIANLLDTAIGIPGTRIRFGLDGIVGLVPGVGDGATALVSLWIVYEAAQLGLPPAKLARMLANVGIDAAVGAVPVLGDVFDVVWKANRRNLRIIAAHFDRR